MPYIPKDAKWYVAEIIEEITVEGDARNVVHKNLVLVRGDSPEEAYEGALDIGRSGETSYPNPEGALVRCRFRGLGELNVIRDELEHGAELLCQERIGVAEDQIKKWVRPREKLSVFAEDVAVNWPDHSSKEITEAVQKLTESKE